MKRVLCAFATILIGLWGSLAGATTMSLNGIWSNSAGGYLVMLEAVSGGTVVILQVEPELAAGKVYIGTRSGDSVSTTSTDRTATLALSISSGSYSGTNTHSGSSTAINGTLLFAYVGGDYDGIWQRSDATDRYLGLITATISQASMVVVLDVKLDSSGGVGYDVVLGTMSGSKFVGKSLITATNTVTMNITAGSPNSSSYVVTASTIPPRQLENFSVSQIIPLAMPSTPDSTTAFALSSASYANGAAIPVKHACTTQAGSNISPALSWSNPPTGTSTYAIVMDDEVSPCGTGSNACIHWNAFNLPSSVNEIGEGVNPASLSSSVTLGTAYNLDAGYQGPCPPSPHIYKLTVYALDSSISFSSTPSLTRSQFASTYASKILGSATLTGMFGQ